MAKKKLYKRANYINMNKIAQIESSNNPNAENPESGARGLCQIMEPTWGESVRLMKKDWAWDDAFDADKNRQVGNFYMNRRIPQMLKAFKIPDSVEARLAAYNWGVGNLRNVYNEVGEDWVEYIPDSVKNYILKYRKKKE